MTKITRVRLVVRGQVQGVGFRPYVYRLATRHQLTGAVGNDTHGAWIEVEGAAATIATFERDLVTESPPLARISAIQRTETPPTGDTHFRIEVSASDDDQRPDVTPDAATCADCLRELHDPTDRRHGYAFINCTNCGPRYSIIRDVPYDRPQTTMSVFQMCDACQAEYDAPSDRRFHAQPNACPVCGPEVRLTASDVDLHGRSAIEAAAELLKSGRIIAVKGIGGYHLACRADREDVVSRLRERKLRDGKPLAVMVPDVATAGRLCNLTPADEAALQPPGAPIVLCPQRPDAGLAKSVAPGCRDFGLMLPYAPLHHLLFAAGLGPLVMTSANISGQPLTYRDDDATAQLADVADAFLTHNREIYRPIDDSVVFTFRDDAIPMRRARGLTPQPLRLNGLPPGATNRILATGGDLKSAVCLLNGTEAIVSEHLGDLSHPDAYRHFVQSVERLRQLFAFDPDFVACDLHPRYLASGFARQLDLPLVEVQHHHAHIASVMAEHGEVGPVIGLSCDGTGYGTDGATWGCEVLRCERGDFQRLGQLEYFPQVGGDAAAIETWRPAAALLHAACGDEWRSVVQASPLAPPDNALELFSQQLAAGLNAVPTSSLGRVFDAVAFLLGLCPRNRHEAEAAMALEAAASRHDERPATPYPFRIEQAADAFVLSLREMVATLANDSDRHTNAPQCAARFHETIAQGLCALARRAAEQADISVVALSGGCFANRLLLSRVVELLEEAGLTVLYNRQVPAGDGGIALGQAWIAAWTCIT